jgi:hypothetical protein
MNERKTAARILSQIKFVFCSFERQEKIGSENIKFGSIKRSHPRYDTIAHSVRWLMIL